MHFRVIGALSDHACVLLTVEKLLDEAVSIAWHSLVKRDVVNTTTYVQVALSAYMKRKQQLDDGAIRVSPRSV